MSQLDFRKPDLVFLDRAISHSGKYLVFFGLHYNKGHACYDVGSSNKETGEIIRRHYNTENNMAPEASAKTYWNQLKEAMLAPPKMAEEPTQLEQIHQWLDINDPNWRKRKVQ